MSQIDLKEATIKIWDGTLPFLHADSAAANSDLTFTAVYRHYGSKTGPTITIVDPGAPGALSVSVSGLDITINLAYADSAVTSTATDVVAAIVASADASALITAVAEGTGAGLVDALVKTSLTGQNSLTIKVGEGNLQYTEHHKVKFTKDRGIMDTVREDEDEPMDVTMDFTWEFLKADTGATPTIEDALKKRGEAAAWVSTADDQCQPYCVDIEILNAPNCVAIKNEIVTLEEFYYESLDHDLKDGSVSTKGRCNRKEATVVRQAAA